jgi:hypothetical protein
MSYFISEKWLSKKAAEFGKVIPSYQIAALMHIYFGTLALKEIAEKAGLSLDKLYSLRREPLFMFLVDLLKKEYSKEFREDLLLSDYLPDEYDILSADFTMLDEMVQMQIKAPLFAQLRDLSMSLKSQMTSGLSISTHELTLFKRLFTFFSFVEKYAGSLTSKSLQDVRQIAEKILSQSDINEIDRKLDEPILLCERRLKELRAKLESLFLSFVVS